MAHDANEREEAENCASGQLAAREVSIRISIWRGFVSHNLQVKPTMRADNLKNRKNSFSLCLIQKNCFVLVVAIKNNYLAKMKTIRFIFSISLFIEFFLRYSKRTKTFLIIHYCKNNYILNSKSTQKQSSIF